MKQYFLHLWKLNLPRTKIIVLVMIYLLIFGSCKTCPPIAIQSDTVTVAIVKHHHDTTLVTRKDSSWFYELLECVNGKVIEVDKPIINNGKTSSITYSIKNNVLDVKCLCDTQKIRFGYISVDSVKTEKVIQTKTVTVNELKWWQIALMWIGGFSICFFIVYLIIKLK